MNSKKWYNCKKPDWTNSDSWSQPKNISEIPLSTKPLAASPQAAWDQGQETYTMLSQPRNSTPATFKAHQDDSEVKQLYLALLLAPFSGTVSCQDLPSSPGLSFEIEDKLNVWPGFWYFLHGLLNKDFHHSRTHVHSTITYKSATTFYSISALSQMAFQ